MKGSTTEAETYYYMLQELYPVTGLIKKNGILADAYVYDGYGKAHPWGYSDGDLDRDGDVDATDRTIFNQAFILVGGSAAPTVNPLTDLDMDGDTDNADSTAFNVIKDSGGPVVQLYASPLGNPFHFTGRRLFLLETRPEAGGDPEENYQLQRNGARFYDPREGRWLQRDPLEYGDSMNLYQYVRSNPLLYMDPLGTGLLPSWFKEMNPNAAACEDAIHKSLGKIGGWGLLNSDENHLAWSYVHCAIHCELMGNDACLKDRQIPIILSRAMENYQVWRCEEEKKKYPNEPEKWEECQSAFQLSDYRDNEVGRKCCACKSKYYYGGEE